jgi:hypothetical protein
MGIQTRSAREEFSRLRQSLRQLVNEMKRLVEPFFSDRPVIKGTVYELRRRCGKPGCKCAKGELHARMVVSASEKGRTRLRVIPRGLFMEVQERVKRYQDLRRVRGRLVAIHRQMLRVLDKMEAMRREELPSSNKKGSSKGE